ncbi:MAG TPA: ABC transporter permease [Xanthobacteraceae bacterium]|nr:ABC transporter permease [Xanthobacteraceae bacterium]
MIGRRVALPAQYVAFPVAVLVVWQACAQIGLIRRNVLPPPTDVALVWYDLVTGVTDVAARYSGTWVDHAAASIWRVFAGFAWGVALGTLAGLLIGLSRIIERVLDPTIQVLRNIPVTAWVPLSLVFFGIGNAPAVFLIGLGAFFPAVVNTTHGVRQVSVTLIRAARMMGADERELLVRVILPGALPSIMTGMRGAFHRAARLCHRYRSQRGDQGSGGDRGWITQTRFRTRQMTFVKLWPVCPSHPRLPPPYPPPHAGEGRWGQEGRERPRHARA